MEVRTHKIDMLVDDKDIWNGHFRNAVIGMLPGNLYGEPTFEVNTEARTSVNNKVTVYVKVNVEE
jgi:hypothetical protein